MQHETKTCPVCGRTFSRMPWHDLQKWERATYCSPACVRDMIAARRRTRFAGAPIPPPLTNVRCDCGNCATTSALIVQLDPGGRASHGYLPLCDDCKQLFDEQESAARVWGCVRPEPHVRYKIRR